MPFTKETAAVHGAKGGKRGRESADLRTKQLTVKVTEAEYAEITEKAETLGISKADLIVQAVAEYDADFKAILKQRKAQWLRDNPDRRIPSVEVAETEDEQE